MKAGIAVDNYKLPVFRRILVEKNCQISRQKANEINGRNCGLPFEILGAHLPDRLENQEVARISAPAC